MVKIEQLKKRFKNVHALQGVSWELKPGHVTGLIGPNACGKTTLIKSILGLVKPDSGEITIQGQPIRSDWLYRGRIGYMPQNPDFPGNLTVEELLDLLEDVRESDGTSREELIRLFELGPFLGRPFGVLSGGTKQKVAAVVAFMFDPDILILDEPSVGLDPLAVLRLKDLMVQRAARGRVVLLVSHIMSEIEQLVGEMAFMLDGQILFSGSPDSIQNRAGVKGLEKAMVALMEQGRAANRAGEIHV